MPARKHGVLEYGEMRAELHGPWEHERALAGGRYRRAIAWWVEVPLVVGLVVLAVAASLVVRGGIGTASAWADVALSALILPVFALGVAGLAALVGLVYLLARLLRWLPGRSAPIAARLWRVSEGARRGSRRVAALVIAPSAVGAGLQAALRGLRGRE
jgi:hypothetical protein